MLELRSNCEHCNCQLAADSLDAMICSYECTFCKNCVETLLENVCPNCGGGFYQRPVRPKQSWCQGTGLNVHPATQKSVFKPVDKKRHQQFAQAIKGLPAHLR